MTPTPTFPDGFVWGTASAAYQIEGAAGEDGRGPSIWDTFSHAPGHVLGGDTGDVACDHYHRWKEDLDLLVELGIPAYRFSVSWPRVLPEGSGAVNHAGLDFYRRLVDGLLEREIAPLLTLYHWDLPEALQSRGGWQDRDVADRFADFAGLIGRELGDRVRGITTLNEPWCSAFLGYATGEHAPGLRENALAYRAAHHLNLAHGRAVTALRAVLPRSTEVSVTLNVHQIRPASTDPRDVAAARHADAVGNRIFLDPMLRGAYPEDLLEGTAHLTDWSFVHDGDLAEINAPIDALGVNYYAPGYVAAAPDDAPEDQAYWPGTDAAVPAEADLPTTIMGWPIDPSALTEMLLRLENDYGIPLVVTENGIACDDVADDDGQVHDPDRVAYLQEHLMAVHRAISAGADVRGYYVWTLLDNFEWAWGYGKRFGIVHVDYSDQTRTPKDSARWYSAAIRRNSPVASSPDATNG